MHARNPTEARPGEGANAQEIVIRAPTEGDDQAILRLWRELMELHVSVDPRFALSKNADQRFQTYLDTAQSREDYRVRLATLGTEPVGFAVSCILPNSPVYEARWIGYINDLCVTQRVRQQGIGRRLVWDAVGWLKKVGADSIEVYVAHQNDVARAFWRSLGGTNYLERLRLDLSR